MSVSREGAVIRDRQWDGVCVQPGAAGSHEDLHLSGSVTRLSQGPGLCSSCWAFSFFYLSIHVPAPLLDVALLQADKLNDLEPQKELRETLLPTFVLVPVWSTHLHSGVWSTLREMLNFSSLLLSKYVCGSIFLKLCFIAKNYNLLTFFISHYYLVF